jgi:hypothetical protein
MSWSDAHEHSRRCWWDLERAAWTCPPPASVTILAQAVPLELAVPAEAPLGAVAPIA